MTPFRVRIEAADVDDLRDRLRRTRWPDAETDPSQGVPLAELVDLCGYWAQQYDPWRIERRLNIFPQELLDIGGTRLHVVHARSADPAAVPLLLTHGWPGSVLEFLDVIGPLTAPDHGRAFHVICPSLPGYGFSPPPRETGWGIERIADAWAELMSALGYERFLASGGDWGTSITTELALRHPARLLGIHLTPPLVAAGDPPWTAGEQEAVRLLEAAVDDGAGYTEQQRTRPQTLGYALTDSPAGQLAWILERFRSWVDTAGTGDLWSVLTRDQVLDDVTLYWLTRTAASSARLYWESIGTVQQRLSSPPGPADLVRVPTACSVFRDVPRPSRRWAERRFPDIRYFSEPVRGGHFAAMEQPGIFVDEVRAGFDAILGPP
ncbi:alpha/beta fold hydrolase [Nakamurella sp. YIM 132087]|uniref:Alpha/beta fold hydrolase n=1 Tax=Nakamurella alba TaxID=2665158 RepID=A0A7K1FQP3_9ACTN|nr:epoxide hydrolase family protein [Nakamurella alba]MTD15679.1 alpha/beta fold hydrolase [Nakamurella alba]